MSEIFIRILTGAIGLLLVYVAARYGRARELASFVAFFSGLALIALALFATWTRIP